MSAPKNSFAINVVAPNGSIVYFGVDGTANDTCPTESSNSIKVIASHATRPTDGAPITIGESDESDAWKINTIIFSGKT